jgi:hypothetical protein
MQLTMISNPAAMEQAIAELARACEEDIAKSDRPTDSFPLKAVGRMERSGRSRALAAARDTD